MNSASATTITVNTALFSAGDSVQIQNVGAGVCTVTAGTATVSTAGSLALSQYEGGQLYFNTTSEALFFDIVQSAGMTNPLTTTGDTIYSSSGTTPARLGIGSTGQILTVASGIPSWATPSASSSGLTLITASAFTSATSHSVNNCFSSTYRNYKVIVNFTGVSADNYVYLKLRVSSTDSSSDYNSQRIYAFLTTVGTDRDANGQTNGQFLGELQTAVPNGSVSEAAVYDPFNAVFTKFFVTNPEYDNVQSKPFIALAMGVHDVATSYTGCTLIASTGNITGTIYIYGLAV
jgi:hypothetical protein